MPGAGFSQKAREQKKEEGFKAQPLRSSSKTLLWGEWRSRVSSELSGLFKALSKAPGLKGVAKTFSRVLKGISKK